MLNGDEELKLTYQELIDIKGYEGITQEKATELIEVVFMLSMMVYNTCKNKDIRNISYE